MAKKLGDCYQANGRYLTDKMNTSDENKYVLCHGTPLLGRDHKPYGHAWIEKGNMVIDKSNGKDIKIDKSLYYAIGNIPAKGYKKIYKYTPTEAAIKMLKHKHWGPWDYNPPR